MRTDPTLTPSAWTSDIFIREDAGAGKLSNVLMRDYKVFSNGSCFWDAVGEVLVNYNPVVDYYPFDTQNITFTFGSWSYTQDTVDIAFHANPFLV